MEIHTSTNSQWTWTDVSSFEDLKDLLSKELISRSFHDIELLLDSFHNSFNIVIHDLDDGIYTGYDCNFDLTSYHIMYLQDLRDLTFFNINKIIII